MWSYEKYVELGGKEHYVHPEGGIFLGEGVYFVCVCVCVLGGGGVRGVQGPVGYSHCDFLLSDMLFNVHSNHKNNFFGSNFF